MSVKARKRKRRKDRRRAKGTLSGKNKPKPHKRPAGRTGKTRQNQIKAMNGGRTAPESHP